MIYVIEARSPEGDKLSFQIDVHHLDNPSDMQAKTWRALECIVKRPHAWKIISKTKADT